jgi:hypothetical protein
LGFAALIKTVDVDGAKFIVGGGALSRFFLCSKKRGLFADVGDSALGDAGAWLAGWVALFAAFKPFTWAISGFSLGREHAVLRVPDDDGIRRAKWRLGRRLRTALHGCDAQTYLRDKQRNALIRYAARSPMRPPPTIGFMVQFTQARPD